MFITNLVLTHSILVKQFVLKRGLRCEQPGSCHCARRKAQEVFQGGVRPHIPVMAGYTSSYPGLQGIPLIIHLEEGRNKTHTKSFIQHTELPPTKVNWAPTHILKGYADLEITKETRNLAPLPVSRHCLHIRKRQTQVVFNSSFESFTMVPPTILLQVQPHLEGTQILIPPWAVWAEDTFTADDLKQAAVGYPYSFLFYSSPRISIWCMHRAYEQFLSLGALW